MSSNELFDVLALALAVLVPVLLTTAHLTRRNTRKSLFQAVCDLF